MGELEAEVMSILWDGDGWMTPRQVLERVGSEPPVVYSTVMTILRRLWKKGIVDRRRSGRAFTYHPVRGRGEQTAERMTRLLEAADDPETALSHFLGGMDARRRRRVREILDEGSR
ncbi:BlaI/MecI/CopY family transcriptional regulator [Actinomarinicola tropica]|nr:BlaI/MecI/CopY family transcriptional regulator [Actinomarinicola tropica]